VAVVQQTSEDNDTTTFLNAELASFKHSRASDHYEGQQTNQATILPETWRAEQECRVDRERVETSRARQECRVQKRITELHRTLDSAVNFGPGEEVPSRQRSGTQACHMHRGNQRDDSSGQNLSWKLFVKDKWVKQDLRLWTRSGEFQRISRSQGVKPSRSVKIPK